jgi:hypothetical protein
MVPKALLNLSWPRAGLEAQYRFGAARATPFAGGHASGVGASATATTGRPDATPPVLPRWRSTAGYG